MADSVDRMLKAMVREEVEQAIAPLRGVLEQYGARASVVDQLSSLLSGGKRKPGRPPKILSLTAGSTRSGAKSGRKRGPNGATRSCAIKGCKSKARSKGYCAAHYQKFRNLRLTHRLPPDWKENAPPHSVKNIKLPRGRAGAKALQEAKKSA